jgi:two-component system invasion response regulator UvrY
MEARIAIFDDNKNIRESIALLLNTVQGYNVVGSYCHVLDCIDDVMESKPDIILMDIEMPGMSGIEATPLIRKYSPGSKIVGVSLHSQPAYARKMMQQGAMGYVTKNSSGEEMIKAIIEVYNNRKYICDEIKSILSDQMINGDSPAEGLNSLSKREVDIIGFIKQGMSSREIADAINISVKTVEVHRYNILKKLKMKNVAALVNYINNSQLTF